MIGREGGSLHSRQSVAFFCHLSGPLLSSTASPMIAHGKPLVNALLNLKVTTAVNAVILPESAAHSVSILIRSIVGFR